MKLPDRTNKNIAVLSNDITKSSYNLTLTEHRMLKMFISSIGYNDILDIASLQTLNVKEYASFWGIRAEDVREELLKAGKTLFDRYIFQGSLDDSYSYGRWISSFKYKKELDEVHIRWTYEIIEHISLLRERFVKLDLSELVGFKSMYTFRLYEILITVKGENSYRNPKFKVEDLMFMLDVPISCKEYKLFKNRVIAPTVKELKEKVKSFKNIELIEHKGAGSKKVLELEFSKVGIGAKYKEKV